MVVIGFLLHNLTDLAHLDSGVDLQEVVVAIGFHHELHGARIHLHASHPVLEPPAGAHAQRVTCTSYPRRVQIPVLGV